MPELVFLRRGDEVLRYRVDKPRAVIGRGEKCDVSLPDPGVSREQFALVQEGGKTFLEDLSGKGTEVGGKRVTERAPLADGADIAIGQWRALFHEKSSADGDTATEVKGTQTEAQP